jgi:hypothetical protein
LSKEFLLVFLTTVADISAFQKAVLSYDNINALIVENVADKRKNYVGQIKPMQNALAKIVDFKIRHMQNAFAMLIKTTT